MNTKAKWISAPVADSKAAFTFSKNIAVTKQIKKATIKVSAMGIYVLNVNGARIGNGVLTPGWTSYKHRIQYQVYDVTQSMQEENHIQISVGQGWAVGCIGYKNQNHFSADKTSAIAEISLIYCDGTKEVVVTDESWQVFTSKVTFSEIYHGETQDLTYPIICLGAAEETFVKTKLVAQRGEWITEHERLAPIEIIKTPKGETVLDFGQNMTGYVELKIKADRGSRVVLHHAEVLDSLGNFYTENFRTARNENTYICSGGHDVFKPLYSFQGFRYVRLTEYPLKQVNPDDFRAVAVYSDIKRTGHFVCGNDKINQLYHNVIWGQKSNYLDIPTDCPQRDERLGWLGDAQAFCRTGAINYDVEAFFDKWLEDVALEQLANGAVKGVVPCAVKDDDSRISAAWGDAVCIIPWELYCAYGNKRLLKKNFPVMKKWVDYVHGAGAEEYLWLGGVHYGDWLAMDAGEDSFVGATSNDLIASAFFAHSVKLLIKAGEVLGINMEEYKILHENVRKAFRDYFMENGLPKAELPYTEELLTNASAVDTVRKGMTQTAIVLILYFELCDTSERGKLAKKLVELMAQNDNLMSTGFVGTPYLLHVLSDNGYADVAYRLLFEERNPSWLYSVNHGATTMWEHWNGIKEDGTFWSTDMNSFNHYAYGAVFDWIFGVACGVKPMETNPAYKEVTISPIPHKALGFVDSSIKTRHGTIKVKWYYIGEQVRYEFEIPLGVTAHITLPSGYKTMISAGVYHF